jgi:hypothetical protein
MSCYYKGPQGPTGMTGQGPTGYIGSTGFSGLIGPSKRGDIGPTGKNFIIEHPNDNQKLLIHSCLEGPEAGVYYRGVGEITNNTNTIIVLPNYVNNLVYDLTINVTAIYDGKIKQYNFTELQNNTFSVYGENGKFNWSIIGKRHDIVIEPLKTDVIVNGEGPYLWGK